MIRTDQAHPSFMDQRRRLQGLTGLFLGHFRRSELPQFLVDQGQQFL
jgi:hypothetical protein